MTITFLLDRRGIVDQPASDERGVKEGSGGRIGLVFDDDDDDGGGGGGGDGTLLSARTHCS